MGNGSFHQKKLLQNLGGKDGIIGKSISGFVANPDDVDGMAVAPTLVGCCVIGQAEAPAGVIDAWKASQEAKKEEETHEPAGYGQYPGQ